MKRRDIGNYGICSLSAIPVRMKADRSSMVLTQMLFGEYVEVLTVKNKHWIKVICLYDQVVGWVDPKQILFLPSDFDPLDSIDFAVSLEVVQPAYYKDYSIPIPIASSLPFFDGISFYLNKKKFSFSGQAITKSTELIHPELLTKVLRRFLTAPESRGGRTIFGIDSSAFVQLVFKIFHIELPRLAQHQIEYGQSILFHHEMALGDIAFFENKQGVINHVGIVYGHKQIIHVHGQTRIDKLDQHGIFNSDERRYTHKLRIIQRIDHFIDFDILTEINDKK